MLVTGNLKRSISTQNDITDFIWNLSLDNTTGSCRIGLSGSRDFSFNLQNSKIYDNNNSFVASYSPNVAFSLSGQIGQRTYDYWIDSILVGMEIPIETGSFDWMYINAEGTNVNFDGTIKGRLPDYSLENAGKYLYENYVITGKIINNDPSRKFRIFNAEIPQSNSPYTLTGFTTGDITQTGYIYITSDQIGLSDEVIPISLTTNFGQVNFDYYITGDYTVIPDIYLNLSPDASIVQADRLRYYDIIFSAFPSGSRLGISLEYYSGITGNVYYYKQATKTGSSILGGALVEGSGVISIYTTGIVSGLDPLTNIVETGFGSGYFSTPVMYAIGNVSKAYSITGYGLGSGIIPLDYEASGLGFFSITGIVPIVGVVLPVVGYNFAGTGQNPGIATGIVPQGNGYALVSPTGCFPISSGLIYLTDYISGILTTEKIFEGNLSYNYSVLGVGYATGKLVTGTIDSRFLLSLEQGNYTFTKYFSGVVTGRSIPTGLFDPSSGCFLDYDYPVTGLLTGIFSQNFNLDCTNLSYLPDIEFSGRPSSVFGNGSLADNSKVILISPSGGFLSSENLENYLNGVNTRTRISRPGYTTSGSGYFSQVFDECTNPTSTFDQTKLWKEFLPSLTQSTGKYDSLNNQFYNIHTTFYISGSGTFNEETTSFETQDSGIIYFTITGTGAKTFAFQGLNLDSETDRSIEFYLYRNGAPTGLFGFDGVDENSLTARWQTEVFGGLDKWRDTAVILENLVSGNYALYVMTVPITPPQIYFTNSVFSGCETSENILIQVGISGEVRRRVWFEIDTYDEITAHSGRNYDPVFVSYTKPTGNRRYLGGYFDPGAETGDFYEFTVPVYNDATFGRDHEVDIYLTNPSGCEIVNGANRATIRILDDDMEGIPTGVYDDYYITLFNSSDQTPISVQVTSPTPGPDVLHGIGYGINTGYNIGCVVQTGIEPPEPPDEPEPPPRCADFDCVEDPATFCSPAPCECDPEASGTLTVNCPPTPPYNLGIVTGKCEGELTLSSCGTKDWMHVGSMCMPAGGRFGIQISGCNLVGAKLIPTRCFMDASCVANVPTGSEDIEGISCFDYAKRYNNRRPRSRGTQKMDLFIKVDCNEEHYGVGPCRPWEITYFAKPPKNNGTTSLCPDIL